MKIKSNLIKLLRRVRAENKPFRFLLSRIFWVTGLCRFFLIKGDGYLLRFYPTALSCGLWSDNSSRKEDEEFINDYLKKNDIVIDIGANIGALSIFSAVKVGRQGKVFAFEPHPKIFDFMNRNIKLNRLVNINSYNVALGNELGTIFFSSNKLDDMNSVTSRTNQSLNIKIDKLDNIINNINVPIALIKIDVEGYEKFVIEGADKILKNTSCLYFESSEDHFKRYNYSSQDLFQLIYNYGFKIYSITAHKVLSLIDSNHISKQGENLIAIREIDDFTLRTGYKIIQQF